MDEFENFRNIVAASPKLSARWDATADHIIGLARSEIGVELSREDVLALPSARLATLTDDGLSDTWRDEASRLLKQVKDHNERETLKKNIQDGESKALDDLARLPRDQRMTRARELGLDSKTNSPVAGMPSSESERVRLLLSLPPAKRLALAREWRMT